MSERASEREREQRERERVRRRCHLTGARLWFRQGAQAQDTGAGNGQLCVCVRAHECSRAIIACVDPPLHPPSHAPPLPAHRRRHCLPPPHVPHRVGRLSAATATLAARSSCCLESHRRAAAAALNVPPRAVAAALNVPPLELAFAADGFRFGNPGPFDPGIGPACVLPCTQGSSDVSGDVRGTGPRDRAHARAPACQRGSCPTRDYATPRRCDLKPRSFESRAQYERMWTLVSNPLGTCVNPGT